MIRIDRRILKSLSGTQTSFLLMKGSHTRASQDASRRNAIKHLFLTSVDFEKNYNQLYKTPEKFVVEKYSAYYFKIAVVRSPN